MSIDNLSIVQKILDNENLLAQRADQKAISLLSILGVFMVFFIINYRVIPVNIFTIILIVLYFLGAILSIINLLMAIRPRVRVEISDMKVRNNMPAHDPAFFGGICNYPHASAYKEALNQVIGDEATIMDIYIRQIYTVAQINASKYMHVQRGVLLVVTTLSIEFALIVYLFISFWGAGKIQ